MIPSVRPLPWPVGSPAILATVLILLSLACAGCSGVGVPAFSEPASYHGDVPEDLPLFPAPVSLPGALAVFAPETPSSASPPAGAAGTSPGHECTVGGENGSRFFVCSHSWAYRGEQWSISYAIPQQAIEYYRGRSHGSERNYAQYAVSDYDRGILREILGQFNRSWENRRYSRTDTAMNLIAFVQSLPYTPDNISTGYDEYPKFPLETLVDRGGDCEDTSILTAAMLNEMDVPAVLIAFPGHMAVGVAWDEPLPFPTFEYQGTGYSYVETTVRGGTPGEIPPQFRNQPATIHPLVQTPRMEMSCTSDVVSYTADTTRYLIRCSLENTGSGKATGCHLAFEVLSSDPGTGDPTAAPASLALDSYDEGAVGWAEHSLEVARNRTTRVRCTLTGDNFLPVVVMSE
ncbi:MAG: hypothetical protein LUQ62_04775, partial [Methanomicrobiales archaeon]|nr:hypothetical protein [Methanomicrobiales archaeon]